MTLSNDKQNSAGTETRGIVIQIDRKEYRLTDKPPDRKIIMTGWELRKLAKPEIDEKRDLFEVVPGGSDKKIGNDDEVEIRDGMRFFSAPARINPGLPTPGVSQLFRGLEVPTPSMWEETDVAAR